MPLKATGGEGVLIAERWILTAAHRIAALQAMNPAPRIAIGGREHEIASLHPHPDWKNGATASDIGLIRLKKPVASVEPSALYRDADEGGKTVIIVGHGGDGKKRAAINTVDRLAPRLLWLKIKPPEEASDLQGAAVPGDSGGPAFVEASGRILVAGIFSAAEGDWQAYVRVSAYVPWIEAVMLDAAKREVETLLDGSGRS